MNRTGHVAHVLDTVGAEGRRCCYCCYCCYGCYGCYSSEGEAKRLHRARASSALHWLSQVSVKLTRVGMAKVLTP